MQLTKQSHPGMFSSSRGKSIPVSLQNEVLTLIHFIRIKWECLMRIDMWPNDIVLRVVGCLSWVCGAIAGGQMMLPGLHEQPVSIWGGGRDSWAGSMERAQLNKFSLPGAGLAWSNAASLWYGFGDQVTIMVELPSSHKGMWAHNGTGSSQRGINKNSNCLLTAASTGLGNAQSHKCSHGILEDLECNTTRLQVEAHLI